MNNPYDNYDYFSPYGDNGSYEPDEFYGDFIPGTDEF